MTDSSPAALGFSKFVPPKDVETHKDIQYCSQGHVRQRLDLYLPKPESRRPGRIPLIIYIHGGAFMFGSKESTLLPGRLLSKGTAIASLDYRLSGDAIFPASVEDCKSAVRWLRAHASEYDLDAHRIIAWGESAGAHQASMLGVTCASAKGDEFDVGDHLDTSSAVSGVVAYYGPTDFLQMDSQAPKDGKSMLHDPVDSPESKYIGGAIQEIPDKVARANPISYISDDEKPPPFFLAHGTNDHVVPLLQSVLLQEALKGVGVPVTLHEVEGADHVFLGASKDQMNALDAATDEFLASIFG
ncbi:alpha/beta-hydrolase [Cryphonectria parasitica EP155]|uniref:Alpha/beta-hydrolase n=1 Tax=Cryphonectria parasitica (strain ATCC 38755 / EP155) TaxID=660469 RepID=A0A9P4XRK0_CRYP1|nr:alpha/beta-hydrolase [Cryphonectria parasitica EP155]KAF3759914.1 alpha/beta-hydrolase [Cryphonectria parasitica EP155]